MQEIKREDLIQQLKEKYSTNSTLNSDALDFVLWKLNELKHEVNIKMQNRDDKQAS